VNGKTRPKKQIRKIFSKKEGFLHLCDEIMNVFDADWLFGGGSREPCLTGEKGKGNEGPRLK